jgi:uncharacterized SAM-binding protein YcdF (DUF218 family)
LSDTVKHKILKKILIVIEILGILTFLCTFPVFNSGNIAGLGVMTFLLLMTVFWNKTKGFRETKLGKAITVFVFAFLILGFAFAGFLTFNMTRACFARPEKPNMVVVLGCQLWGEEPSPMLKKRLDKAYDLLIKYPDVPVVVTGGQGDDEVISEGEGMKRYLMRRGISEDRIIVEDKSTSTYENIKNAFEITDSMGLSRDITIATSEFHVYRASLMAKKEGAGEVTSAPAFTDINLLPTYWVREWLGISHFLVFGD